METIDTPLWLLDVGECKRHIIATLEAYPSHHNPTSKKFPRYSHGDKSCIIAQMLTTSYGEIDFIPAEGKGVEELFDYLEIPVDWRVLNVLRVTQTYTDYYRRRKNSWGHVAALLRDRWYSEE